MLYCIQNVFFFIDKSVSPLSGFAVGYVVAGLSRSLPYAASAGLTLSLSAALLAAALVALPKLLPGRAAPDPPPNLP